MGSPWGVDSWAPTADLTRVNISAVETFIWMNERRMETYPYDKRMRKELTHENEVLRDLIERAKKVQEVK